MKKRGTSLYISILLGVLTCIFVLTPSSFAATGVITGKVVNLRTGPGTNYSIAGQINKSTQVAIITSKNGWYQIQLTNGRQGWVKNSYLTSKTAVVSSSSVNTTLAKASVKVTGSVVNLRQQPSASSRIISQCRKGDVLIWKNTLNGWYQVTTKEGKTAYIASAYAILDKYIGQTPFRNNTSSSNPTNSQFNLLVTGSTVNLRTGPGTEYIVSGKINKNEKLNTDKQYNGWYRVLASGKQSWIAADYVQLISPLPTSPSRGSTDRAVGEIVSFGPINTFNSRMEALELQASSSISIDSEVIEADGVQRWNISGVAVPNILNYGSGLAYEGLQIVPTGPEQAIIKVKVKNGYQLNMIKANTNTYRFNFQSDAIPSDSGSSMIIVVDPGHGGNDPGAMYFGANEKDINLAMGLKLGQTLEQAGYQVVYTRDSDSTVSLATRCQVANTSNAVLFVSIHCNASSNKDLSGTTTYYCIDDNTNLTQQCLELANQVQSSLITNLGTLDKGVRTERFQVIRDTSIPSILVETAFMSNNQDFALLSNEDQQAVIANAITQGIGNYLKR